MVLYVSVVVNGAVSVAGGAGAKVCAKYCVPSTPLTSASPARASVVPSSIHVATGVVSFACPSAVPLLVMVLRFGLGRPLVCTVNSCCVLYVAVTGPVDSTNSGVVADALTNAYLVPAVRAGTGFWKLKSTKSNSSNHWLYGPAWSVPSTFTFHGTPPGMPVCWKVIWCCSL